MNTKSAGFTLVELLVVIAIIGTLSSIVIANVSSSRRSSEYLKRVADLGQIKLALTQYQLKYGKYPTTAGAWAGYGNCLTGGGTGNATKNFIPDLVTEKYLPYLPTDIKATATCSSANSTYSYKSNGKEYKLIVSNAVDLDLATKKNPEMLDPVTSNNGYGFWSQGSVAAPDGGRLY
jgi:prepilin-type N-terminal cleavage/methylation domain-containing protein